MSDDLGVRPMMEFSVSVYEQMMEDSGFPFKWPADMPLEEKARIANRVILECCPSDA